MYQFGGFVQFGVVIYSVARLATVSLPILTVIDVMGIVYTFCIHAFDMRVIADFCINFSCKLLKLLVNTSLPCFTHLFPFILIKLSNFNCP